MKDFMQDRIFLFNSKNIKIKNINSIYLIDNKQSIIDLNNLINYQSSEFNMWQNFSKVSSSAVIVFTKTSISNTGKVLVAIVFEKGDFLSIVSEGKAIYNNMVTVFDMFFGRLGIVFEKDLIDENLLYLFDALNVDYLLIYLTGSSGFTLQLRKTSAIKILINNNNVLFT